MDNPDMIDGYWITMYDQFSIIERKWGLPLKLTANFF